MNLQASKNQAYSLTLSHGDEIWSGDNEMNNTEKIKNIKYKQILIETVSQ